MAQISKEVTMQLKKKLEELKSQRKEIAERLQESASFGDLSENFEYQQAREDKERLERKILELEQKIIDTEANKIKTSKEEISLYSKIELKNNGKITSFKLVSPEEVDLSQGKISYESPLGKGLLGRKTGEKIQIETPQGIETYKILKCEYDT